MKRTALAFYVLVATGCCHLPPDPGEPGIKVASEDRYTMVGRVEAGQAYLLTARGMWRDLFVCTDASGFDSIGLMKRFERKRRLPDALWFALVGVITATPAIPANDQASSVGVIDLTPYLSADKPWVPSASGTLHVFANDMPSMYRNNDGFIRLHLAPYIPQETTTPPSGGGEMTRDELTYPDPRHSARDDVMALRSAFSTCQFSTTIAITNTTLPDSVQQLYTDAAKLIAASFEYQIGSIQCAYSSGCS